MIHGSSFIGMASEDQTVRVSKRESDFTRGGKEAGQRDATPLLHCEKMMVGHLDEIVELKPYGLCSVVLTASFRWALSRARLPASFSYGSRKKYSTACDRHEFRESLDSRPAFLLLFLSSWTHRNDFVSGCHGGLADV